MQLELILRWDKQIPYKSMDMEHISPENLNGIEVEVNLKEFNSEVGYKQQYRGNLTTSDSVDSYLAHLVWSFISHETNLVRTSVKRNLVISELSRFDEEKEGYKRILLQTTKVDSSSNFKRMLSILERRWYIVARKEMVNDCDYWSGFFRASNGFWRGSLYPHANPSEHALQLAYDLEKGIRQKFRLPFYPGCINFFGNDGYSNEEVSVIRQINKIIKDNANLQNGIADVISNLRKCASMYESLQKR